MGFYGSDLSMQYLYNNCTSLSANAANLYQLTGAMCNDLHNAYYAYPTLIFRFFSFSKLFSNFQTFYFLWAALITMTILSIPYGWLKKPKWGYYILAILALIQAPTYYAIERGGTDITFLLSWMAATYFGLKNKWVPAGIFMAIAALFKLYPVMAIMPILLGLFFLDKKKFFICGFSIAITVAVFFAFDWHLWKTFVFEILPHETKFHIGTNAIGHSLIGPFPKIFVYPLMFCFWYYYAKVFKTHSKLAFAAVLAMSTYFNGHSFDYNLITIFPFLFLCIELYWEEKNPLIMWGILILLLTIWGPANLIFSPFKFLIRIKLLLELLAFALVPFAILRKQNLT
jgi:hypothetical protein